MLRDLAFAATTLTRAGLEGGDAYGLMLGAHAKRLPELAEACEEVLALSSDAEAAAAKEAFGTARSLLFATVDAESSTTGLKAAASTAGEQAESGTQGKLSLQEARERIDLIEPGFLESQDKNAQFLKEEGLGAAPSGSGGEGISTSAPAPANAKASAVEAAAAYLKAKQAAQQPMGKDAKAKIQDAKAALLANKGGAKSAAAAKYLALRKKQQAAEAYLEAKKKKEQGS